MPGLDRNPSTGFLAVIELGNPSNESALPTRVPDFSGLRAHDPGQAVPQTTNSVSLIVHNSAEGRLTDTPVIHITASNDDDDEPPPLVPIRASELTQYPRNEAVPNGMARNSANRFVTVFYPPASMGIHSGRSSAYKKLDSTDMRGEQTLDIGVPEMDSPPLYDAWAYSPNGTVVIGSNTRHIPSVPQWDKNMRGPPMPRTDGRWGFLEYSALPQLYSAAFPYLAWMPVHSFERLSLPTEINEFRPLCNSPEFVRHNEWGHRGYLETTLREAFQRDVVWYIDTVQAIIKADESEASGMSRYPGVRPPVIAMVRAHNAAFSLRFPHLTYRDLLEYLAGLQRAIAELQAYIMWHDRMEYAELRTGGANSGTGLRGSIAMTQKNYNSLRMLGVPVWLELQEAENVWGP
ncbi:hypothetical protein C8R44DRAFT_725466 [Mycena epipterygia]|nr:hypothetical protein C8R44DRAFT_725466 [Mycena epipterygia]